MKRKVFKKSSKQKLAIPDNLNLPHITATCCCNIIGEKMPLFITLPSLVKLPQDLIDISENGKAFFSSSNDGWQTRDTFLYFVICFINWLSRYRLSLQKKKAILIVDGHKSRKNPIAIKMLQENNISLFVLPAHTS